MGAHFIKSKHIQRLRGGIHTFCPDFKWFRPAFHQIKSFGSALAPPPATGAMTHNRALRGQGLLKRDGPLKVLKRPYQVRAEIYTKW